MSPRALTSTAIAALVGLLAANRMMEAPDSSSAVSSPETVEVNTVSAREPAVRRVIRRTMPNTEPKEDPQEDPVQDLLDTIDEKGSGQGVVWIDVVDVAGRLVEDASLSILHCEWEDSVEGVSGFMSPPLLFSTYGKPFQAPFSPGVCSVQATRYDGLLPARSPVETVYIEAGEVSYTRLVLPPEKGGLGIQLGPALEGVEVVGVFEDSPAWEAGIEVGDIIAAVDGARIDRLSLEDTGALISGPVGEAVQISIVRYFEDGSRGFSGHVLNREYLREDLPVGDGLHHWD